MAPVKVKLLVKATKVKKQDQAQVFAQVLKAAKCLLQRRVPKRGFNNIFAKEIIAINVGSLESFENGAVVDTQALIDAGLVNKCCDGIKILGNGKLTKSLTVKVGAYSEGAKQKIESAGGKAEVI